MHKEVRVDRKPADTRGTGLEVVASLQNLLRRGDGVEFEVADEFAGIVAMDEFELALLVDT